MLIVQVDRFDATNPVTVCALTTNPTDAPLFRLPVAADITTSLHVESRVMIDKVTTVPRVKLGEKIGHLSEEDMIRVDRALMVILGLAGR